MRCCPVCKVWCCYIQWFRRCIYMKIHWPLTLTWGQSHTISSPVPSTSCNLCTCTVWRCYFQLFGGDAYTRKFIIFMTFDIDLGVMQNVEQYPLQHVTYAAAKFEVAMSNSLGGGAFTFDIWPWGQGHTRSSPVPSTSCDLCTVWSCYVQRFGRRCINKKIHYMTFDLYSCNVWCCYI